MKRAALALSALAVACSGPPQPLSALVVDVTYAPDGGRFGPPQCKTFVSASASGAPDAVTAGGRRFPPLCGSVATGAVEYQRYEPGPDGGLVRVCLSCASAPSPRCIRPSCP